MEIPTALKRFVEIFQTLPGVGPRQAVRLAFFFINKGPGFQDDVSRVIADFKKIQICRDCFYIHENKSGLCNYCSDSNRDQSIIAIVEKGTDIISLENTKKFNGRYLILGDVRKKGILESDQKLRLKSLIGWIKKEKDGKAKEIIVAISPTLEGDMVANIIMAEVKPYAEKITRLGRGIPMGGEVEFADEETLGSAIERRS